MARDDDDEKPELNLFNGKPLPRPPDGEPRCSVQCGCGGSCCRAPECGGSCVLEPGHPGEHECAGDKPGWPGTCPA